MWLISILAFSCSQKQFQSQMGAALLLKGTNGSTAVDPIGNLKLEPLAWESQVRGSKAWSNVVYNVILDEEPQMLGAHVADDVEIFCPAYRSLTDNQRLNFWGQLIAAMSKFESSWSPTNYYVETTMGQDDVTGQQVASEGLLQLSYQDEESYRMDCGFDWSVDQQYSIMNPRDPRKTILQADKNLRCGIKILARQLNNQRAISTTTGVYWAVLKKNGKYTKVPQIAELTKKLTFCE